MYPFIKGLIRCVKWFIAVKATTCSALEHIYRCRARLMVRITWKINLSFVLMEETHVTLRKAGIVWELNLWHSCCEERAVAPQTLSCSKPANAMCECNMCLYRAHEICSVPWMATPYILSELDSVIKPAHSCPEESVFLLSQVSLNSSPTPLSRRLHRVCS